MKTLEFYDLVSKRKVKLTNYKIKVIRTKKGLRKQAIGNHKGHNVYRFVGND